MCDPSPTCPYSSNLGHIFFISNAPNCTIISPQADICHLRGMVSGWRPYISKLEEIIIYRDEENYGRISLENRLEATPQKSKDSLSVAIIIIKKINIIFWNLDFLNYFCTSQIFFDNFKQWTVRINIKSDSESRLTTKHTQKTNSLEKHEWWKSGLAKCVRTFFRYTIFKGM